MLVQNDLPVRRINNQAVFEDIATKQGRRALCEWSRLNDPDLFIDDLDGAVVVEEGELRGLDIYSLASAERAGAVDADTHIQRLA